MAGTASQPLAARNPEENGTRYGIRQWIGFRFQQMLSQLFQNRSSGWISFVRALPKGCVMAFFGAGGQKGEKYGDAGRYGKAEPEKRTVIYKRVETLRTKGDSGLY